ncbi:MAG: DUF1501 domain-containing protein [Opitutaceae bacterium]|nr:DUF1501 domain-containing protein [Opitutaceae bacterium]
MSSDLSRRQFLGSTCCAAVGATGLLSSLATLRLMGAVASPANGPQLPARAGALPSDYKALVCLFLNGGNDANNLIIPNDDAGYNAYVAARSNLALPRTGLLPLAPKTPDGRSWALHAAVPELHSLFNSGKAALLANVGTLVYPTTRAQYLANSVPLPRQLFSHSDQQVQWQNSVPDKPSSTGWGGRLADLVNAFNSNNEISMSISLAGKNYFQVGKTVNQYAVGTGGAVTLTGSTATAGADFARFQTQKDLFGQSQAALFDAAFAGISKSAITDAELLNTVLSRSTAINTPFPANNNAANQLRMAARLIAAAPNLGLKRQVFFVQLGGWDTHAAQLLNAAPTTGTHATLLSQVSQAVDAFYKAMVEIGAADQVTLFSSSDFGRTYRSNGDGSDHGWGNHQFIVGGAVKGGDLYGRMPVLTVGGPDDTTQGRWIPTTSVDEFAATLATWFGVSPTDLSTVLPNIGRFPKPSLGFL